MKKIGFRLVRPRRLWLPTMWGWLLIACITAVATVVFAVGANRFLALSEPARGRDGAGASVLVIEGWIDQDELDQALERFRRGHYRYVVTTGGPIESLWDSTTWSNYAERAADYLRAHGLTSVPVVAVPAPASAQDRTFLSAVMVREWGEQSGVELDAVDVYTRGVHARRSRMLYQLALGDGTEVGILAAWPSDHDPERWWTNSVGVKSVVMETVSVVWTACCFWPGPPGSHAERWGR